MDDPTTHPGRGTLGPTGGHHAHDTHVMPAAGPQPGRVMRGIAEALAQHGALSYEALSALVFGHGFTIPDRSSISRAARAMERKGKVVIFLDMMVTCVARADFDHIRDLSWEERDWEIRRAHGAHVEEARRVAAAAKPGAVVRLPEAAKLSRAELLRQDPSYGDRQDCTSCGMSYAECFLLGDNIHKPGPWDGSPYWCCFECFHKPIKIAPRFSSNGHHPQRHAAW
jgi:hypothetical protein